MSATADDLRAQYWAWVCVVALILGFIILAVWMLSTGDPFGQGPPPTTVLEFPIG